MNWPKIPEKFKSFVMMAALVWISGCGVKGDPLPPERPPDLGRGRPTYKKATEGLQIEKSTTSRSQNENEDEEDEDKNDE